MKKHKRKRISATRYNEIMDKIINKNLPVADTLIEMLREASRYEIIESKKIS